MHAIIRVGSHQYDAAPGQTLTLEKLDAPVGSEVRFRDVLLVSDGEKIVGGSSPKGTVVGKIVEQLRGPKITVFHKKPKKGHTKKQGHRQAYTKVQITGIEG